MELDARVIRETLAGYQAASEFMEQERRERLQRLTESEALAIYESLDETWSRVRSLGDGADALEEWRLETTLVLRRALDSLALRPRKA